MLNTLKSIYYSILFKSNKFKLVLEFRFFTNFSFYNSDNNRVHFFKKLRIFRSCASNTSNNNGFITMLTHNVGIRVVDFNTSTINRPLRSKFYMNTYCTSFDKYQYKVDFLISEEPLSTELINYLVYILNIRFNLTGRYFYTGFFLPSYLKDYKFFTLVTSPDHIKIYLVNKDNYEMYVNLLNTGGLYVLDYDLYPLVLRRKKLDFLLNPISYREVPLSNIITRNYLESFTSFEIEVALSSDYDNKFYKYLTGHLSINHWDLTQEGYISCPNRSTFFSSYYKEPLRKSLTIVSATREIKKILKPLPKKRLKPLVKKSLPLIKNGIPLIKKSPNLLTSSIFYLVRALNMRFNISGRYFYYEGLNMKIGGAEFYPYGFSIKGVPFIKVYKLKDSNLKDFLMVLKYGTKKFDVEYSFCRKHFMEYDGPIKYMAIRRSNRIYMNVVEYYFHYKLKRFIENQLRSNNYAKVPPLAPYKPYEPQEEEY